MSRKDGETSRYDWSSMPSVMDDDETARRLAEIRRHDELKAELDRGHGTRLILAVPIVVWTLALMAVVILGVVVPLLQLFFGAVSDFVVDGWVVAFVVLVVLAEWAAIWSALILIKDAVRPRAWLAIVALAAAALVVTAVMLLAGGEAEGIQWPALAAMAYVLIVAVLQLRRARRVRGFVDEVEGWYP